MKTQMRFQKILTLVTLIISALTVVYALIFFSGSLSDIYRNLEPVTHGAVTYDINAKHFYEVAQSFNNFLFIMGIVFICVVVTLYITSSNKRRNYYITNYISIIAVAAFAIVFAIVAIILLSNCLNLFVNEIDWETYLAKYNYRYVEGRPRRYPYYSDDKTMFILGYILFFVVLANGVALILNLIWKIKLMRGEKELLSKGFNKEVA